jgi:hypothetical protein
MEVAAPLEGWYTAIATECDSVQTLYAACRTML